MIRKVKKYLTREERIIAKRKELAKTGKVAAIWTRVSSADQYKQNFSIDTQNELVKNIVEGTTFGLKAISEARMSPQNVQERNSWI